MNNSAGCSRSEQRTLQDPLLLYLAALERLLRTQVYLTASLALKEKILAKTTPHAGRPGCYRPDDKLLGFLNSL